MKVSCDEGMASHVGPCQAEMIARSSFRWRECFRRRTPGKWMLTSSSARKLTAGNFVPARFAGGKAPPRRRSMAFPARPLSLGKNRMGSLPEAVSDRVCHRDPTKSHGIWGRFLYLQHFFPNSLVAALQDEYGLAHRLPMDSLRMEVGWRRSRETLRTGPRGYPPG